MIMELLIINCICFKRDVLACVVIFLFQNADIRHFLCVFVFLPISLSFCLSFFYFS